MTHKSLGKVKEMNVVLDGGEGGYARVVLVPEEGDTVSFLIPREKAHKTALSMSKNVTERL